jgi:hypothetical protein
MPTAGMWVKSLGEDATEVETTPAAHGRQGRRQVAARASDARVVAGFAVQEVGDEVRRWG